MGRLGPFAREPCRTVRDPLPVPCGGPRLVLVGGRFMTDRDGVSYWAAPGPQLSAGLSHLTERAELRSRPCHWPTVCGAQ